MRSLLYQAEPRPEELWQGRQDSNLQPTVLEAVALPIAPHPCTRKRTKDRTGAVSEARTRSPHLGKVVRCQLRHYRVGANQPLVRLPSLELGVSRLEGGRVASYATAALVPPGGFEPPTKGLKVPCATIAPRRLFVDDVDREDGPVP